MLREVAEAEDGAASVISTRLNLGLPLPDTGHAGIRVSAAVTGHRPYLSQPEEERKKRINAIQKPKFRTGGLFPDRCGFQQNSHDGDDGDFTLLNREIGG